MKLKAEFENGRCKLTMVPEGDWEQRIVGAVLKDDYEVFCKSEVSYEGHQSYGKVKEIKLTLSTPPESMRIGE